MNQPVVPSGSRLDQALLPDEDRPLDSHLWTAVAGLLRHRSLILTVTLLCGFVVGLMTMLTPRRFTSSASFVLQEAQAQATGLADIAAQYGVAVAGQGGSQESPQFYADLLASREILAEVLVREYDVKGPPGQPFSGSLLEYLEVEGEDFEMAKGYEALRQLVTISADRGTGIVSFEVQTTNPQLSIAIGQTMLDLLADYNIRRRQSRARAEREFVEQRVDSARVELKTGEDRLAAFYRENRNFAASPDLQAAEARLQREVNLRQQIFLTLNQRYEGARIEEVRATPVMTVIDAPSRTVEPGRRGTIVRTAVALVLGFLFSSALAFVLDLVALRSKGRSDDLDEVRELWSQSRGDLRRLAFWRRPAPSDPSS